VTESRPFIIINEVSVNFEQNTVPTRLQRKYFCELEVYTVVQSRRGPQEWCSGPAGVELARCGRGVAVSCCGQWSLLTWSMQASAAWSTICRQRGWADDVDARSSRTDCRAVLHHHRNTTHDRERSVYVRTLTTNTHRRRHATRPIWRRRCELNWRRPKTAADGKIGNWKCSEYWRQFCRV